MPFNVEIIDSIMYTVHFTLKNYANVGFQVYDQSHLCPVMDPCKKYDPSTTVDGQSRFYGFSREFNHFLSILRFSFVFLVFRHVIPII